MTSPFSQDWRDCLQASYQRAARLGDQGQLRGLTAILLSAGFSRAQLQDFFIQATAHVDDAPDGFLPDLSGLSHEEAQGREDSRNAKTPDSASG